MKYSIAFLLLFLLNNVFTQNTNFSYKTAFGKNHYINHVIETKEKDFIVALNSFSFTDSVNIRLIKLNRSGELIKTLFIRKPDFNLYIQRIIELDSSILSFGGGYDIVKKKFMLFIGKSDKNLNGTTLSFHPIPDGLQNVNYDFDRDSNIIIGGGIQFKNNYIPRLFGAKLNKRGDFMSYTAKIPDDSTFLGLQNSPYFGYFDAFKVMKDSARYVFFDGWKIVVVDTSFNAVNKIDMPYINNIALGLNPSVLRLNDTTYCINSSVVYFHPNDDNRDLYFLITTLSRQVKTFKTFGNLDTVERQNDFISLDSTRSGQFYFGGTFNDQRIARFGDYPFVQDTSQFVLYKLDKNYNLLWTKRYGQNALYEMQGLLATSDGGCLMYGYRYDYNTIPRTEAYIIKVDGNGFISSETSIPLSIPTLQLAPNPGNNIVQALLPNNWQSLDFRFFDYSGKIVKSIHLTYPNKELDLSDLNSGLYIFQVFENGHLKGNGKWVKQ